MGKKKNLIITIILCFIVVICSIFIICSGKTDTYSKRSKYFINAISYIKENNYNKAYEEVKKSKNEDELEIIQTIFLYKLYGEWTNNQKITDEIAEQAEHITDYLQYPFLYKKDKKYQKRIDEIYAKDYVKLYDIKKNMSADILFEDTRDYYNKYFEYVDTANGVFKNYEYNIRHDRKNLANKLEKIGNILEELEIDSLTEKHSEAVIPEEYLILLDLDSVS